MPRCADAQYHTFVSACNPGAQRLIEEVMICAYQIPTQSRTCTGQASSYASTEVSTSPKPRVYP